MKESYFLIGRCNRATGYPQVKLSKPQKTAIFCSYRVSRWFHWPDSLNGLRLPKPNQRKQTVALYLLL